MGRVESGGMKTTTEELKDLEKRVFEINSARLPLIDEKRKLENEMTSLNGSIRGARTRIPDSQYQSIVSRQKGNQKKRFEIDNILNRLKREKIELCQKIQLIEHNLSVKKPFYVLRDNLISLRDKYAEFSSDPTRVSSMRLMASQFSGELTTLLDIIEKAKPTDDPV